MIYSTQIQWALLFAGITALSLPLPLQGQGTDPLADTDPFAKRNRVQAITQPIDITFSVTDADGSPVNGARIRGPGIFPALSTRDGAVVWHTGGNQLRRWAIRSKGHLRFHCIPPVDAVMPNVSTVVAVSELLKRRTITFQTRPGVRLMGQVIGSRDKTPIEGVTVVAKPSGVSGDETMRSSTTDERGRWSIVAPRVDSVLTLRGYVDGYILEDVPNPTVDYARSVEIPKDVDEISALDFEVEQLQPLRVFVTDASGRPVSQASVSAYRQHWLDDQIVVWDQISRGQSTDTEGECSLFVRNSDWRVARVSVTASSNQARLVGQTSLPSATTKSIRVTVSPHSRIGGVLRNGGNPAAGVQLVLYEAIKKEVGGWATIGLLGETTTNDRGHFVFESPVGRHYIVATKSRDQNGVQRTLHRTTTPTTSENYRIPDIDL